MAKRFSTAKGPSQRQLRAGEVLRHALVEILQREDLTDPAMVGVSVTVTEVRPSPDLRQANVYCTSLGGRNTTAVVRALNDAAVFLRGLLGRKIELKFTPALRFLEDASFDEAERIDNLLADPAVKRDIS